LFTESGAKDRRTLWKEVTNTALNYIHKQEDSMSFKIECFNRSMVRGSNTDIEDAVCIAVFAWDRNASENIDSMVRGDGGCCSIF
jgi:hypothetical protein